MKLIAMMALTAGLLAAPQAFAANEEITINGSTTVLPVMQKAGEAFMAANPGISLAISGGGSGSGIKALNEGLCKVAMSSRDITPAELEAGKAKGVNAKRIAIAVDALIPVVHPENPIKSLTFEQLKNIYEGKITNWKEVGGQDSKIVLVSRDSSSGTYETWEQVVMKKAPITQSALLQASNGAVAQTVAKNKKAIGYIGFGYLNKNLKKLDIDGIEATPATALEKKWPIARELYIFTNGEPQNGIKKLVTYLLDPQKGQKAVLEAGYIPLK